MPLGASPGWQPCAGRSSRCLCCRGCPNASGGPCNCIEGCLTPSCLLQAVHETGVFQNGQRVPTFRDRFGDSNNFQQSGNEEPWVRTFVSSSAAHATCIFTAEQAFYPLQHAPALITVRLTVPANLSVLTVHLDSSAIALTAYIMSPPPLLLPLLGQGKTWQHSTAQQEGQHISGSQSAKC